MSDTPTKKVPVWSWLLIILPIAAVLASVFMNRRSGSASINGEAGFDPGPVIELEIKGVPANGASSWGDVAVSAAPAADEKLLARGKDIYVKACAACHGGEGKGDGVLVTRLNFNSRPANFTTPLASFKLRSTEKGTLPTDEDIFRTLTRGLPGTAMLSFRELPEADRWALVQVVKEFWKGPKKWPAAVPLEPLAVLPKDEKLMEEGRHQFGRWCQNCHGGEGMGGTSFSFSMERAFPGVVFARGGGKFMLRGSKPEDIVRTLQSGMSGVSPMMSFKPTFYGDEPNAREKAEGDRRMWGTAYYVRKVIDDQIKADEAKK